MGRPEPDSYAGDFPNLYQQSDTYDHAHGHPYSQPKHKPNGHSDLDTYRNDDLDAYSQPLSDDDQDHDPREDALSFSPRRIDSADR